MKFSPVIVLVLDYILQNNIPLQAMINMRLLAELPSSYRCSNLTYVSDSYNNMMLSFDIAPFPYKHAQRRITFQIWGYQQRVSRRDTLIAMMR